MCAQPPGRDALHERHRGGRPSETDLDAALSKRAARQHGLLTRAQMLDAGLGAGAIAYRLKSRRLHLIHRGVYAVGYVSASPLPRAMAAVLACGPGAVLSHRSAAALWDIASPWQGAVDVTARSLHGLADIAVHGSPGLDSRQTTVQRGIPVTPVARTLIDLADVLDERALARAVNEARVKRLLGLPELDALLSRSPGRRATMRLRRFLEHADAPTRSALEDLFLDFVEGAALPRPEPNQRVGGHEVAMLWRRERLIVELDSRGYHGDARAFERDRDRDATLLAEGYRVLRVTWRRLVHDPDREARRLRAILALDAAGQPWNRTAGDPPRLRV